VLVPWVDPAKKTTETTGMLFGRQTSVNHHVLHVDRSAIGATWQIPFNNVCLAMKAVTIVVT